MSELDLKRFQLLAELEDEEREAVSEELEVLEVEEGTLLFDEGEQGEGLYLVASGAVQVESSRGGRSAEFGPGAALGAFALVVSGAREARARASRRSQLLLLRRSSFRRFSETEPRAACRLLEAMLRETARLGREALAGAVDPLPLAD